MLMVLEEQRVISASELVRLARIIAKGSNLRPLMLLPPLGFLRLLGTPAAMATDAHNRPGVS